MCMCVCMCVCEYVCVRVCVSLIPKPLNSIKYLTQNTNYFRSVSVVIEPTSNVTTYQTFTHARTHALRAYTIKVGGLLI